MRGAAIAVLLAGIFPSCASGPAGYWTDRARDLTDVAHVDLLTDVIGVAVNVGPLVVGGVDYHGWSDTERTMLGLGGVKTVKVEGSSVGLVIPFMAASRADSQVESFAAREPSRWSIGVDVGFLVGVGARVDFLELLDLLGGFGGTDLMGDDRPDTAQ